MCSKKVTELNIFLRCRLRKGTRRIIVTAKTHSNVNNTSNGTIELQLDKIGKTPDVDG